MKISKPSSELDKFPTRGWWKRSSYDLAAPKQLTVQTNCSCEVRGTLYTDFVWSCSACPNRMKPLQPFFERVQAKGWNKTPGNQFQIKINHQDHVPKRNKTIIPSKTSLWPPSTMKITDPEALISNPSACLEHFTVDSPNFFLFSLIKSTRVLEKASKRSVGGSCDFPLFPATKRTSHNIVSHFPAQVQQMPLFLFAKKNQHFDHVRATQMPFL